jgi:hypothetical protein
MAYHAALALLTKAVEKLHKVIKLDQGRAKRWIRH